MIRCTSARVDLAAIQANYRALAAHLAREADLNRRAAAGPAASPGILAVVKANAYGHGAVRVARALRQAGAEWLAVADIEEGIELREAGDRGRILVFGALSVSDVAGVFTHDLTPTVSSPGAAQALGAASRAARHPPALPPEDRHRPQPPRLPPRQPAPHAAPAARRRRAWRSRRSTPTSPPPTNPNTRCSRRSANASTRRGR